MKINQVLAVICWLLVGTPGHTQQIVCERLLNVPGLQVRYPTACAAPNGEFIVSGAAQPLATTATTLATHTLVARLGASGCDTLWTRRLPHSVYQYATSAVRADAKGIWLLTPDTINTATMLPPFKGARLWRFNSSGQT